MDDRTTFDAVPPDDDDLELDAAERPSRADADPRTGAEPGPGSQPQAGPEPRPGAEPGPGASVPAPRSRADRSRTGDRSAPVDWATLVDDLAASDRPTFTAATSEDREMELRLCHLHLRTGSFAMARIQLETLAGAGHLDREGLLDLAEARWRTGDLPGAAQAVDTYLEAGGNAPMGHVIAAEARSALGRPGEARRHARLAIEGLEVPLDALFAGQPRSAVWPQDPTMAPLTDTLFGSANAATAEQGGRIGVAASGTRGAPSRGRAERSDSAAWVAQGPGGAVGGGGHAASRSAGSGAARLGPVAGRGAVGATPFAGLSTARSAGVVASAGSAGIGGMAGSAAGADSGSEPSGPADVSGETGLWDDNAAPAISPDAHAELERARVALSDGELHAAALRLSVVLRTSPALAPVVLDVVGPWPGPEFAMVRGDALRLVGRESAAQQAYAAASAGIVDALTRPKVTAVPSARSDSRLVPESREEPGGRAESDSGRAVVPPPTVTPSVPSSSPSTPPSPLPIDRGDPPPS